MVPSTEGRAGEALDDEAGVFVSMSEPALLDWLLVRRLKPRNDILSHKEQTNAQKKLSARVQNFRVHRTGLSQILLLFKGVILPRG
jgi:hypothetical protein